MKVSAEDFAVSVRRNVYAEDKSRRRYLELRAKNKEQVGTGERYGESFYIRRDLTIDLDQDDLLKIFIFAASRNLLIFPAADRLRKLANEIVNICERLRIDNSSVRRALTNRSKRTRRKQRAF